MLEWAPFAIRRDGPSSKVGYEGLGLGSSGPKRGDVKHSAEGYWDGIHSVLDGPRRASWHFTVGYDRVEQHYPISTHCWHAGDIGDDGGVRANIELEGIEHLGLVGQILTPYQVEMTVKISQFCAAQYGKLRFARYPAQGDDIWTLVEHNQVSDDPTSCPSGRVPWVQILAALEDDMSAGYRHNAVAAWFAARVLQPGPYGAAKDAIWQLRSDLGLPPAARWVEVELFLTPANGKADGLIMLFDGGTPDGSMDGYAGQVSLKEGGHGTITVQLDDAGTCRARYPVPVRTDTVGCLRWFA